MNETIVKAIKVPYNKDEHLSLLERIKPVYGIENLVKQLESENWFLYNVVINEKTIGIFIVRLDTTVDGNIELTTLHAVSALRQKIPFVVIIESLIDDIARQSKCKVAKMYSDSLAMNKLIEKHSDYKLSETVYTKDISNVK